MKLRSSLRFGICIPNYTQISRQKRAPGRNWFFFLQI
nr:unnamed protein product [Callosobruchus chinensis]